MFFGKYYNGTWFYTICAANVGSLVLLLAYCIHILDDLSDGFITPKQCSARLNIWAIIKVVFHVYSAFVIFLHESYIQFLFDVPLLIWRVWEIIQVRKTGLYDENRIGEPDEVEWHVMNHVIDICFFGGYMCVLISRVYDVLEDTYSAVNDWYPMYNPAIVPSAFMFLYLVVVTYAAIGILTYNLTLFTDITELKGLDWIRLCEKLNFWLIAKLLLFSLLSSILLAYGTWVLFTTNLSVFVFDLWENLQKKENAMGIYDPVEIRRPGEINRHKYLYQLYLGYCIALLFAFTYMMVNEYLEPFFYPAEVRIVVILVFGGLLLAVALCTLIAFVYVRKYIYIFERGIHITTRFLKISFYINTILHMHLSVFLLAQGHWFFFLLNLPVLIIEVLALFNGLYEFQNLHDEAQLERYIRYFVLYFCLFFIYAILYVFNLTFVYTGPTVLELAQAWLEFHKQQFLLVARNISFQV